MTIALEPFQKYALDPILLIYQVWIKIYASLLC